MLRERRFRSAARASVQTDAKTANGSSVRRFFDCMHFLDLNTDEKSSAEFSLFNEVFCRISKVIAASPFTGIIKEPVRMHQPSCI